MLASTPGLALAKRLAARHYRIDRIERTTVRVPYREVPDRNMARELPHWRYSEVFEVTLASGITGFGETLLYYTWGATEDADVQRASGQNALDLMWDDSLGAGLQMALFDAVARTLEVPIHRLLGQQVHQQTPLSWWNIDTSAEDMASECRTALESGYRAYKTKGRPWYDVWEQARQVADAVPDWFKLDMDFNDTLLDADRAIPILKDLAAYPQIGIYESPIFQSDIPGNVRIRKATRVPVAMHYGTPSPADVVRHGACDGFVIGGGATRVMQRGTFSGQVEMPFWLQLVGTSITAAWSLHFGAVLEQAVWPAVNCHQLYQHTLLKSPIPVKDGMAPVPDGPGLGYELDREQIELLRVEKPASRPEPPRLIETRWLDGRVMFFANTGEVNFVLNAARDGKVPFFERGVQTRLIPDDGSKRWQSLHQRGRKGPFLADMPF